MGADASRSGAVTLDLAQRLTPDLRARIAGAAQAPEITPWQRDVMLGLSGRATGRAAPASTRRGASIDGTWQQFGTPPPGRRGHSVIYDPVRDRLIVFGGVGRFFPLRNDTWELPLSGTVAWSRLATAGPTPAGRIDHSAIYDPVRDRMIVFGGQDASSYTNETWALTLSGTPTWAPLAPTGTPPVGRAQHGAIYDPIADRMIVFGGFDGASPHRHDTWCLSLSGTPAWREMTPGGTVPPGLAKFGAVYDPEHHALLAVGGTIFNGQYTTQNKVWSLALDDSAWSVFDTTGTQPPPREDPIAVFDAGNHRVVMFGGDFFDSDTWFLSLGSARVWTKFAGSGEPPPRNGSDGAYDPVGKRMIVFGGALALDDTWELSLGVTQAWSQIAIAGPPPAPRTNACAVYDPLRDRLIVFGGYTGDTPSYVDDTWSLSLTGAPAWHALAPIGPGPVGRSYAAAIYDPIRDRMVVFGGAGENTYPDYLHDVWALDLGPSPAWSQLAPAGTPPLGRLGHSAVYDPGHDRMIVFGGYNGNLGLLDETWALDLATPTWSKLPTSAPGPVDQHTAIVDPVRNRMLVFGGESNSGERGDVWAFALDGSDAWTILSPGGPAPPARRGHDAVYDPARDRMVIFGGYPHDPITNAWALDLSGATTWAPLFTAGTPPSITYGGATAYDPVRDRMLVFGGGGNGPSPSNDMWALAWSAPVRPTVDCPESLAAVHPAPGRYVLTNPLPTDRAVEWRLDCARAWPGFPVRGALTLGGLAAESLGIEVPLPDTATVGPRLFTLSAWYAGGAGYADSCAQDLVPAITSALATLVSAIADPERVALVWHAPDALASTPVVERRTETDTWRTIGTPILDGTGLVRYEDRAVTAGATYRYRLREASRGEALAGSEVRVTVPAAFALSIDGLRVPGFGAAPRVTFAVPDRSPAVLEVFDVAGRRIDRVRLDAPEPGRHDIALAAPLAPGVYALRLTQGGRVAVGRFALVR